MVCAKTRNLVVVAPTLASLFGRDLSLQIYIHRFEFVWFLSTYSVHTSGEYKYLLQQPS